MNNKYIDNIIDLKNKSIYFKDYRWLLHVIFWSYILHTSCKAPIGFTTTYLTQLVEAFFSCISVFLFYYIYCIILVPKFYKKNKYLSFILLLIASILIISLLDDLVITPVYTYLLHGHVTPIQGSFIGNYITGYLLGYLQTFFIFSCILYFCEMIESITTDAQIEESISTTINANRNIEKNQMSTNNITARLNAIEKLLNHQTENSTTAILHYSQVLRYELYSSQKQTVSIAEELQYITNYYLMQNNLFSQKIILEIQNTTSAIAIKPLSLFNKINHFLQLITTGNALNTIIAIDNVEANILFEFENINPELQNQIASKITTLHHLLNDVIILQDNLSTIQSNINICIPIHHLTA